MVVRKEGDDAELVLFIVDETPMAVVILGVAPPLPPAAAAAESSRSSTLAMVLVAAPAPLLLVEPNDTHVDASSSPLPLLSVRSSSGSKVCALL